MVPYFKFVYEIAHKEQVCVLLMLISLVVTLTLTKPAATWLSVVLSGCQVTFLLTKPIKDSTKDLPISNKKNALTCADGIVVDDR
jgi:hypothetical protein